MARIVLGVSGGIAAYKSCLVLRLLREAGHSVRVVPTASALSFVGSATWEALSGEPVDTTVFTDAYEVPHVALGQEADLVVVAPATASLLARAAGGVANDLLTNVLLTARSPVVLAPAMHTEMWENGATRANVATLRERGFVVLEPADGRLTGTDSGLGRMPEPAEIADVVADLLIRRTARADLAGLRIVVTAGGTREPLDPVRFLGNRSSGRQGYALAATAAARGANAQLVSANVELPVPAGVTVHRVETAAELKTVTLGLADRADCIVMAAAVADFRPSARASHKLKKEKGAPPLDLVPTDDVLVALTATRPPGQVIVGFAAETGDGSSDWLAKGQAKLLSKGCDVLVVNEVGVDRGIGTETNSAVIMTADGKVTEVPEVPKRALAHRIWDVVVEEFASRGHVPH